MTPKHFAGLIALMMFGCQSASSTSGSVEERNLKAAADATVVDARQAITQSGVTDAGLSQVAAAMARLAGLPGLLSEADLRPIHGSTTISQRTLASEGPEGINLYLTRLLPGARTPVHDHATWGVVYVLGGQDRHIQWRRVDDGSSPGRAKLEPVDECLIGEGQAAWWLLPPGDIHSQEAVRETVWELVITGRDLSHATAKGSRHWFDLETGSVSDRPPK